MNDDNYIGRPWQKIEYYSGKLQPFSFDFLFSTEALLLCMFNYRKGVIGKCFLELPLILFFYFLPCGGTKKNCDLKEEVLFYFLLFYSYWTFYNILMNFLLWWDLRQLKADRLEMLKAKEFDTSVQSRLFALSDKYLYSGKFMEKIWPPVGNEIIKNLYNEYKLQLEAPTV